MNEFQLYVYKTNSYRILLTSYSNLDNNNFNSLYSTFDENLSYGEHDQLTLTFSLMRFLPFHKATSATHMQYTTLENQFFKLLHMGSRVELIIDHKESFYFVVSDIKPDCSEENVKYNYTCQDEVSYTWSRRKLGLSYSTIEYGGVQNIYDIANNVLSRSHIYDWKAQPNEWNDAPMDTLLYNRPITLEVENSNPYNIIIEACNTLNACMSVDYTRKIISFYQKDKIKFSGYRYRPEINLKQFDPSYTINELSTILHVQGGVNEYGEIISLVPAVPSTIEDKILSGQININANIDWNQICADSLKYSSGEYTSDINECKWTAFYISNELYIDITQTENNVKFAVNIYDNLTNKQLYGAILSSGQIYKITDIQLSIVDIVICAVEEEDQQYLGQIKCGSIPKDEYEFCQIANRIPCLGNFIYDFSFFKLAGVLTSDEYNDIYDILNIQMGKNNIYIKIYSRAYYRLYSELYQDIQDLKELLIQRQVLLINNGDIGQNEADYSNKLTIFEEKLRRFTSLKSNCDEIEDWETVRSQNFELDLIQGLWDECNNLMLQKDNVEIRLNELQIMYNKKGENPCVLNISLLNDAEVGLTTTPVNVTEDLLYYAQKYSTLISQVGESYDKPTYDKQYNTGFNTNELIDVETNKLFQDTGEFMSVYGKLLTDITEVLYNNSLTTSKINELYNFYLNKNEALWEYLYTKYGHVIYENKYENTAELDSISLYNQAVAYYQDYCRPQASYSISVIDLTSLECINTPRLRVGSKIQIYNDALNLNETYLDINNNKIVPLNNLQYTTNDLIVTSIQYKLRTPSEVSINVEQVSAYKSLLQKLIKLVK